MQFLIDINISKMFNGKISYKYIYHNGGEKVLGSNNINRNLLIILYDLINNWENEVVEFKQASNDYSQHEIGQYFSAISNESRLKGLHFGWLVFGVHNKTRKIVSTDYRDTRGLETLKYEISQNATGGMTFMDIFEIYDGENRVIMFQIPAAVNGIPTAWKGHYYGRNGESLGALSMDELDRLRGQTNRDWSSEIIESSGIKHLSVEAVQLARENYKEKQNREHISAEVDKMTDEEFLTKLKLMVDGKLTNAAMVLLGNVDFDNLVNTPIRIMWRLYGSKGIVKDYEEFKIPFISVVDKACAKIRNLTYRFLANQRTLFPIEKQQYNDDLLKELLNNCIAHQAYTAGGRIYLDEFEDYVLISNPGSFIPGDIREVLQNEYRAPYYRNLLLSDTMKELNMIDTVQMGIRKVFNIQRERYFPLPDYELQNRNEVSVRVHGKVIDINYSRILFDREDLALDTIYQLDRVQKNLPLEKEQYKTLKKMGFIEGRVPNVYISLMIANAIDEREQYTRNKALDDNYYMELISNHLRSFGSASKAEIAKLLKDKLSDTLDEKQKDNKIRNLLMLMREKGIIERADGNRRTGVWILTKNENN